MNLAEIAFTKTAFIKTGFITVADDLSIDLVINLEICPDSLSYEKIV
jgi:hypothetical protein